MGSCANTKEVEIRREQHLGKDKLESNQKSDLINKSPYETPKSNAKYKNFIETDQDLWIGEGIKRMKAYKSTLRIDQLNALKDEFFNSKILMDGHIWKQIRNACLFEANRAESILAAVKLIPLNGCMNLLMDQNKKLFPVPNYCINDPYLEKHIESVDEGHRNKSLTIKLSNVYKQELITLTVLDSISIEDLKSMYCLKLENHQALKPENVRLFFGGVELVSSNVLYQYNLKDGFVINALQKPIDNQSESV